MKKILLFVLGTLGLSVLTAPAHAASIAIAWDPNPEPDVGYLVLYGTSSGRFDAIINVGAQTTWTLTDAVAGRTYYFRVQAYNASGLKSELSSEVSYTLPGGSPAVSRPLMAVDLPWQNATIDGDLVVAGWAIDLGSTTTPGIDAVDVWAYPNPGSGTPPVYLGQAAHGAPRPDVAAAFNAPQAAASGYGLRVSNLMPGVYDVVVFARSTITGTFNNAHAVRVNIQARASRPLMVVDIPATSGTVTGSSFIVAGWALDLNAPGGSGVDAVHIWAYPNDDRPAMFVTAAHVGDARPDVGAAFGAQFGIAGFSARGALPPGQYRLVVFARSTIAKAFNLSTVVPITVR